MYNMYNLQITDGRDGPVLKISQLIDGKREQICSCNYHNIRNCIGIIEDILHLEFDEKGIPRGYDEYVKHGCSFRGELEIHSDTACKLSLIMILSKGVSGNRLKLLTYRIFRFTKEEAEYWLGKITVDTYGKSSVKWAVSGLKTMLCGSAKSEDEAGKIVMELRI